MIHKNLQHHLDLLISLGASETDAEYIKLNDFLVELSKKPEEDWNKQSTKDKLKSIKTS